MTIMQDSSEIPALKRLVNGARKFGSTFIVIRNGSNTTCNIISKHERIKVLTRGTVALKCATAIALKSKMSLVSISKYAIVVL
mmetsp:Transcript_64028/g.87964  ORF Transcript_64028/g.87964 Transcript_64028/m.87964 type:complete len:83 (-) Transcript_64028:131-379(-)